ncbi:hypothetical protein Dip518_000954 [Parelusimicrobium proximum]|uniref:hypothetical protein n=1 Tax=Parelusimicrobium proximum TaxID=3228953 RepID=UPI003D1864AC
MKKYILAAAILTLTCSSFAQNKKAPTYITPGSVRSEQSVKEYFDDNKEKLAKMEAVIDEALSKTETNNTPYLDARFKLSPHVSKLDPEGGIKNIYDFMYKLNEVYVYFMEWFFSAERGTEEFEVSLAFDSYHRHYPTDKRTLRTKLFLDAFVKDFGYGVHHARSDIGETMGGMLLYAYDKELQNFFPVNEDGSVDSARYEKFFETIMEDKSIYTNHYIVEYDLEICVGFESNRDYDFFNRDYFEYNKEEIRKPIAFLQNLNTASKK